MSEVSSLGEDDGEPASAKEPPANEKVVYIVVEKVSYVVVEVPTPVPWAWYDPSQEWNLHSRADPAWFCGQAPQPEGQGGDQHIDAVLAPPTPQQHNTRKRGSKGSLWYAAAGVLLMVRFLYGTLMLLDSKIILHMELGSNVEDRQDINPCNATFANYDGKGYGFLEDKEFMVAALVYEVNASDEGFDKKTIADRIFSNPIVVASYDVPVQGKEVALLFEDSIKESDKAMEGALLGDMPDVDMLSKEILEDFQGLDVDEDGLISPYEFEQAILTKEMH